MFGIQTDYQGGTVHMTGYPAIAGQAQTDQVGTVSADPTYSVLDYGTVAAHPGNSGGPLWITGANGVNEVVGIVSTTGWAAQITDADLAQINAWEQQDVVLWGGVHRVAFVATESVTGDKIIGYAYDSNNAYTVGQSVVGGTDAVGGHWTYTVTGITTADSAHQNGAYKGFVYDTSYYDAGLNASFTTSYGAAASTAPAGADLTTYYSGNQGLGDAAGDVVTVNGTSYAIGSTHVLPAGVAMARASWEATESATGDKIEGYLYATEGTYSIGQSVTSSITDQAGGHWTYTVTGFQMADTAHQSSAYNGYVYDTSYFDAGLGTSFNTLFGYAGSIDTTGADLTTDYSGNQGLGTGGDEVDVNGIGHSVDSGHYVLPAGVAMARVSFQATESATGVKIYGYLYASGGTYKLGDSVTSSVTDQAGGHWTYSVTGFQMADAAHQNAAYNGYVYDTSYFDAGLGTSFNTMFGYAGSIDTTGADLTADYSGNQGLGSGGDVVVVNGTGHAIDSGHYVLPAGIAMARASWEATESATGDKIEGYLYATEGTYSIGQSITSSSADQAGGHWTYTVTGLQMADTAHQSSAYNGYVYDTSYYDGDLNASFTTYYGAAASTAPAGADLTTYYSGNQGLGDAAGDVVTVNGTSYAIGSTHVLPDTGAPATSRQVSAPMLADAGSDAYTFGPSFGSATIDNLVPGNNTPTGEIDFAPGIAADQLWLQQSGEDLKIDVLGTTDNLTVAGWYGANAGAQVQSIDTADGSKIDTQLQQLVSAMASFTAGNPGFDPTASSAMPADPNLQAAIAAAWHS